MAIENARVFEILTTDPVESAKVDAEEKKQLALKYIQHLLVALSCIPLSSMVIDLISKVTTNI